MLSFGMRSCGQREGRKSHRVTVNSCGFPPEFFIGHRTATILTPASQEDGECITFKFGHEEACDRFILCMRILIDQQRDCFNFAGMKRSRSTSPVKGRQKTPSRSTEKEPKERNATQVGLESHGKPLAYSTGMMLLWKPRMLPCIRCVPWNPSATSCTFMIY